MKHYLPIISAFIILFSSCSKEDDILIDEPTTPQLCVKRTVEYFGYSNNLEFDRRISDYNYDGTRLLDWKETRINNNGTTTQTFTNIYTGDNITSMIVSYTNLQDDVLEIYYDFEYDKNKDRQKVRQAKPVPPPYPDALDHFPFSKHRSKGAQFIQLILGGAWSYTAFNAVTRTRYSA